MFVWCSLVNVDGAVQATESDTHITAHIHVQYNSRSKQTRPHRNIAFPFILEQCHLVVPTKEFAKLLPYVEVLCSNSVVTEVTGS